MATTSTLTAAAFEDRKRALAKLMAQENIAVQVIEGIQTAYFDVANRVLAIPDWSTLSMDQWDLLIGHEVGHALFTDVSYAKTIAANKSLRNLMSYFDVVEDARIERKLRVIFPGMKTTFFRGYRDFTVNGPLFKVVDKKTVMVAGKPRKVREMDFIDRINLHYKIGAFVDVPFSPFERKYLTRIDRCYSMENAMDIAKELHELAKHPPKEQFMSGPPQSGQAGQGDPSDGEGSGTPSDEQGDEQDGSNGSETSKKEDGDDSAAGQPNDEEGDGDGSGSDDADSEETESESDDVTDGPSERGGSYGGEDMPEPQAAKANPTSETDEALKDALADVAKNAAGKGIRHLMIAPIEDAVVKSRTIPAVEWMTMAERSITVRNNALEQWNERFLSTAKFMAQEFTRRKTAANLHKARIGKTGKLNMGKLHAYKFADDLFKRSMVVPDGQSHGIVMIIDASGSMSGVYADVLNQALLFGTFAFYARIPFECYLFTDTGVKKYQPQTVPGNTLKLEDEGKLVGLLNTNVNRQLFQRQAKALAYLQRGYASNDYNATQNIPYAGLGGTPLYSGMLLMDAHLTRMKRTLKLDKVMSVVITDGQDGGGLKFDRATGDAQGKIKTTSQKWDEWTPSIVTDMVTKRQYATVNNQGELKDNASMDLLFNVIKDRNDARNIFIYLSGSPSVADGMTKDGGKLDSTSVMNAAMKETGQYVVPSKAGVADCCMVLSPSATRLTDGNFADADMTGSTSSQIANEYARSMMAAKKNRVFSNAVIPFLI